MEHLPFHFRSYIHASFEWIHWMSVNRERNWNFRTARLKIIVNYCYWRLKIYRFCWRFLLRCIWLLLNFDEIITFCLRNLFFNLLFFINDNIFNINFFSFFLLFLGNFLYFRLLFLFLFFFFVFDEFFHFHEDGWLPFINWPWAIMRYFFFILISGICMFKVSFLFRNIVIVIQFFG